MNSFQPETGPTRAETSSFALLRLEQTRLLIPQADVRVLELTMDMMREAPPAGGVGWIRFGEQRQPVYAPSHHLEWLSEVPSDRGLCAVLEAEEGLFGLLCNEVALVKSSEIQIHAMPAPMATPDSPFQQLALHGGKLACLSSATKLFARLPLGNPS